MADQEPNYFVCTLGQAAQWNKKHPHSFHTINDLIDQQAELHPNDLAIGFANCKFTNEQEETPQHTRNGRHIPLPKTGRD